MVGSLGTEQVAEESIASIRGGKERESLAKVGASSACFPVVMIMGSGARGRPWVQGGPGGRRSLEGGSLSGERGPHHYEQSSLSHSRYFISATSLNSQNGVLGSYIFVHFTNKETGDQRR